MATVLGMSVAARRATIDLLARHEHERAELSHKLCQCGASAELIGPALDRLVEEGLPDESRHLESLIASRAHNSHRPLRIREELTQHGLPRADIERVPDVCRVGWGTQLRGVWRHKFVHLPQDAREKAQQGCFLAYRSYSTESISHLLDGRSND